MSEHPQMTAYLAEARWFAGKGRAYDVVDVQRIGTLPGPPAVTIDIVTVEYADDPGGEPTTERYQMPLSHYAGEQGRIHHAYLGPHVDEDLGSVHSYDAVHDREAMAVYLDAFARTSADKPQSYGGVTFHRVAGYELDTVAHSTLFSGEQSNSSVAFGEDSLMKVFRKVTPGRNPDIEVHEALTRAGSEHVAALYGWLEATSAATGRDHDEPIQLAMLQQFLRTGSDGWDLALASVRDLFAEADLHADEVGGDFASESHRLGVATAEVHDTLADQFPTETWGPDEVGELSESMRGRLRAAVDVVPGLEPHTAALEAAYAAVAEVAAPVVVQRVHGDFHLGQTLRTVKGWKLVDFEGEPAKPLAERVRPDSRWRDVAGMLRSFDYAAHAVEADVEEGAQIAYRALEWVERNQSAFLDGYAVGRGLAEGDTAARMSEDERTLLKAYVLDKAVYETVYEIRNRPTWLGIPLGAVERIATEETDR